MEIIWLLIIVAIAAICAGVAANKHRSPYIWFGLGLLFSLIALAIVLFLPDGDDPPDDPYREYRPPNRWGEDRGRSERGWPK